MRAVEMLDKEMLLEEANQVLDLCEIYHQTERGLETIWNEYVKNKGEVLNLLSNHKNYVPDKGYIVFTSEYERSIDYNAAIDAISTICGMCERYTVAYDYIVYVYSKVLEMKYQKRNLVINQKMVDALTPEITGIREGHKINKVVAKICKHFGVDNEPGYNKAVARLGDAANPAKLKRYTIISANIIDFWTMSFGNGWCSCHSIDKKKKRKSSKEGSYGEGKHSSGTESYMLDSSSVVMYTVNAKYNGNDFELQDKINRCMFHIGDRKFIMGRIYPQGKDGETEAYNQWRKQFQSAMAECFNVPDCWNTETDRRQKLKNICSCGTHYPDYKMKYCDIAGWSWNKDTSESKPSAKLIQIGHRPICPSCGDEHDLNITIECPSCSGEYVQECCSCGEIHEEGDMYYFDGYFYCEECVFFCDYCHEMEPLEREIKLSNSPDIRICNYAFNRGSYFTCENCGDNMACTGEEEYIDGMYFCNTECAEGYGYVYVNSISEFRHRSESAFCRMCDRYVLEEEYDFEKEMCISCSEMEEE